MLSSFIMKLYSVTRSHEGTWGFKKLKMTNYRIVTIGLTDGTFRYNDLLVKTSPNVHSGLPYGTFK